MNSANKTSAAADTKKLAAARVSRPGNFHFLTFQANAAFTVIELLVVLGVLGLISGILVSTLSRSKLSARKIQCVSNLRQLGLAAQFYWEESGGKAFGYRGIATNGGDIYWFGWLERGTEGKRGFDPKLGVLYPYLGGRGVEICKSLNYAFQRFKLKAV